jgi:hypothetical protein
MFVSGCSGRFVSVNGSWGGASPVGTCRLTLRNDATWFSRCDYTVLGARFRLKQEKTAPLDTLVRPGKACPASKPECLTRDSDKEAAQDKEAADGTSEASVGPIRRIAVASPDFTSSVKSVSNVANIQPSNTGIGSLPTPSRGDVVAVCALGGRRARMSEMRPAQR